jgi:HEPN domain-containing protein
MTMSKTDHIAYWKAEAEKNWQTAIILMREKQHVMALFMFNLVIEKLLKAHWVNDNADNYPPRIHDLQSIHNQTELDLSATHYDYLAIIDRWNIDTRYPDYKSKIYTMATELYLIEQKNKLEELKSCLLTKL